MVTRSLRAVLAFVVLSTLPVAAQPATQTVVIDATAQATPFPHFWDKAFGSGRAILALRESYRNDLREVKKVAEFEYVRFHAIFHDEVGVYDEDENGNPLYNFSYVDQIYDGLLQNGVRPFVEIGFMPRKLAAKDAPHPFWYKQNVAPPKDYRKWNELIRQFAQHLVDRYGIDEVSQWYFEVWNEPNIDFWAGEPKQPTYFELYEHTARTLKAVSPRLRVGGPSSAAAAWVGDFLAFCAKSKVPVDFVTSHGYADDTVKNLFGTDEDIPMNQRVCRAIRKVHDQIAASAFPRLPLMWTEWNVPSYGPLKSRDTIFVGAAVADVVRQCDGLVDMLAFWTFSDVFEETGVVKEPFYGGFGLMAAGGIKKPSYNAYALLHKLGTQRIANPATNALVTRRQDGTLVIAAWNLVDLDKSGNPISIHFDVRGLAAGRRVRIHRLDAQHGNTLAAYEAMGRPRYPTRDQIARLNQAAQLPPPENRSLPPSGLDLEIPVNGLVILEISK